MKPWRSIVFSLGICLLCLSICKSSNPPPVQFQYVHRDICIDSGELRNTYCPPERIKWAERFVIGSEPKSWCTFHKKPIPPVEYELYNICIDSGLLGDAYCPIDRVVAKKYIKGSPEIPSTFCTFHKKPQPIDKKLEIKDGQLYYGDEPIHLCGVSRLEALWRATGAFDFPYDWGDYSLGWYEKQLIDSGINYVRHLGIKDTQFLYDHCKRMKDARIIVEVGVYRAHKDSEGILVDLKEMGRIADIGNVFFDVANEFIDYPGSISKVIGIAMELKRQGCIVSAGAWSGTNGKIQSGLFYEGYKDFDLFSHHREWTVQSFNEALAHGKPVVFNEYFSQGNLTLDQTKAIMKTAFDMGIHVTYYGFRFPKIPGLSKYDPFDYKSILNYAGKLAKGG